MIGVANAAGITAEVIILDDDEDDAVHDEGANISVAVLDADKSRILVRHNASGITLILRMTSKARLR